MNKKDIILVTLASEKNAIFTPVKIQKLLFLIDKNATNIPGNPFFNFIPYDYGPFDKEIYAILNELESEGDVEILYNPAIGLRKYQATAQGFQKGENKLSSLDKNTRNYIQKLSKFVRTLQFGQLVSAIYQAYPEMRANSVFKK